MINDENELVEDNIKLAYKLANSYYKKFGGYIELEELQSICFLGLTKAAKSFDVERKNAFSTFAYKAMENEILTYYKVNKKHQYISINQQIGEDICLEDTLQSDEDLENNIEKKLQIQQLYKFIDELEDVERKIVLGYLQGLTTKQISEQLTIGVKQINFKYRKAINKLRYKFYTLQGGEL